MNTFEKLNYGLPAFEYFWKVDNGLAVLKYFWKVNNNLTVSNSVMAPEMKVNHIIRLSGCLEKRIFIYPKGIKST